MGGMNGNIKTEDHWKSETSEERGYHQETMYQERVIGWIVSPTFSTSLLPSIGIGGKWREELFEKGDGQENVGVQDQVWIGTGSMARWL